jgi:hypothetical protein
MEMHAIQSKQASMSSGCIVAHSSITPEQTGLQLKRPFVPDRRLATFSVGPRWQQISVTGGSKALYPALKTPAKPRFSLILLRADKSLLTSSGVAEPQFQEARLPTLERRLAGNKA